MQGGGVHHEDQQGEGEAGAACLSAEFKLEAAHLMEERQVQAVTGWPVLRQGSFCDQPRQRLGVILQRCVDAWPTTLAIVMLCTGRAPAQGPHRPPADTVFTYRGLPLSKLTTERLVDLLTSGSVAAAPITGDSNYYTLAVERELTHRRPLRALFRTLRDSRDFYQQLGVAEVISQLRTAQTDSGMRTLATAQPTYVAYFALKYFAEAGHRWALRLLNANFWMYDLPSAEQDELVRLFGKYRYGPAVAHLVETLENEPNLTFATDAERALRAIFPEVDSTFSNYEEMERFWTHYVLDHSRSDSNPQ